MTNERIIFNEVCTHYDALQRHDLVSRFYTAEQVERYTAGLKFEPDGNGNTPDPVEAAEAFLCSKLFHTWAEWHKEGLIVKKGEKAAITCELWKLSDKKKQPKPDADELTKAAAEQDPSMLYTAWPVLINRCPFAAVIWLQRPQALMIDASAESFILLPSFLYKVHNPPRTPGNSRLRPVVQDQPLFLHSTLQACK